MAELEPRAIAAALIGDPGIPGLAAVFDPVTMRECLQRALPDHWGPVQDISCRVLKHHRSRCTVEIAWSAEKVSRSVIGKVYATDRSDVYRAMEDIRRAGLGAEEECSIPEPLAYVPELNLLLQEKVQGTRAKEIFLRGDAPARAQAAERCAHWLARFQALAPRPPSGRPRRAEDVLDALDHWSQSAIDLGGPLAEKAIQLREQLRAVARGLHPIDLCAGHGEYTGGQVLLAQGRTVTVDWDGYEVADPCLDAATFVVDLKRIGWKNPGSSAVLDQAADVFLETYLPRVRPAIRDNLPFYAAARCLRLAHKDIDHREVGWPRKAAAMLELGLRALQGLRACR